MTDHSLKSVRSRGDLWLADSLEEVTELAKGCPSLSENGSVEVRSIIE